MIQTKTTLLVGLLLALGVLTGCEDRPVAAPAAASEAVSGAKVYVVGTDASYVPFEYQNEQHEIVGFDMDVLKAVAAREGFRVRLINTPWEGIFTTLALGERDILASAISITEQRKQDMDFSDPYFEARQLMAIPAGRGDIHAFVDLKQRKVGVQAGTTGEALVQQLQGGASTDIRRFDSLRQALQALVRGEVDAVVGDNGVVAHYVAGMAGHTLMTLEDKASFRPEFYAFAVKKGNRELLDKLNAGIRAIRADGSYQQIYRKYFVS